MRFIKVIPILIAFAVMAGCVKDDEPGTGTGSGFIIDHNDHNRINNFPDNLNLVTYGTNQKNRTKNYNNSSGFTGVGWDSIRQKWRADIKYQGKSINLGRFDNMQDAINMRLQIEHDLGFNPNHGK